MRRGEEERNAYSIEMGHREDEFLLCATRSRRRAGRCSGSGRGKAGARDAPGELVIGRDVDA